MLLRVMMVTVTMTMIVVVVAVVAVARLAAVRSLAPVVLDVDAIPEERVHRAGAEVPGGFLHRRRAHRVQEPAEPLSFASFASLASF